MTDSPATEEQRVEAAAHRAAGAIRAAALAHGDRANLRPFHHRAGIEAVPYITAAGTTAKADLLCTRDGAILDRLPGDWSRTADRATHRPASTLEYAAFLVHQRAIHDAAARESLRRHLVRQAAAAGVPATYYATPRDPISGQAVWQLVREIGGALRQAGYNTQQEQAIEVGPNVYWITRNTDVRWRAPDGTPQFAGSTTPPADLAWLHQFAEDLPTIAHGIREQEYDYNLDEGVSTAQAAAERDGLVQAAPERAEPRAAKEARLARLTASMASAVRVDATIPGDPSRRLTFHYGTRVEAVTYVAASGQTTSADLLCNGDHAVLESLPADWLRFSDPGRRQATVSEQERFAGHYSEARHAARLEVARQRVVDAGIAAGLNVQHYANRGQRTDEFDWMDTKSDVARQIRWLLPEKEWDTTLEAGGRGYRIDRNGTPSVRETPDGAWHRLGHPRTAEEFARVDRFIEAVGALAEVARGRKRASMMRSAIAAPEVA